MGKRRLTTAQIKRLNSIQAQRIARAKNKADLPANFSLGSEQTGLLIAHYGNTLIVESQDGSLIRCACRQNLGSLVTGDRVIWQAVDADTGVVVAGLPRRSVIIRATSQGPKPIVANVDLMLIVLASVPEPLPTTLDRYLILAKQMRLSPLIIINKSDLWKNNERPGFFQHLLTYETLGYRCLLISTKTQSGIASLHQALQGSTSILVGQSGVGKSSLLNVLVPDAKARTNALSLDNRLGQHTTTASTLYHLPLGGDLIDSPGIHQFNLRHFTQNEIMEGFAEFAPYLGKCKFRNCSHRIEPSCALLLAKEKGHIASFRLENYHAILLDHIVRS